MAEMKPLAPTIWFNAVQQPVESRFQEEAIDLAKEVDRLRPSTKGLTVDGLEAECLAAEWLLEALYQAYNTIPRAVLALPLAKHFYSPKAAIQVPFQYGAMRRVLDAAHSLGWVTKFDGSQQIGNRQVTTFVAAGELARLFDVCPSEWARFRATPEDGLIVMGDAGPQKSRRMVQDAEGASVALWRKNLKRINEALLDHCIHLDAPNDVFAELGQSIAAEAHTQIGEHPRNPISFTKVCLRRIFARGRLDMGGRFYGGWWQTLPSDYRKLISINGDMTREADYSGMALNCLYALEGKDMGVEDAYDIGLAYLDANDPRRKIVKRYMVAILNDAKGSYRPPAKDLRILGLTAKELRQRVEERHCSIAHHLHTDVGLKLQFLESEIAESIMLRFVDQGELCLPVHDSFIVVHDHIDMLATVMNEAFKTKFGRSIKVKQDDLFLGERMALPDPDHLPKGLSPEEQSELLPKIHWGRHSTTVDFYVSWKLKTHTLEEINAEYSKATATLTWLRPWLAEQTRGLVLP